MFELRPVIFNRFIGTFRPIEMAFNTTSSLVGALRQGTLIIAPGDKIFVLKLNLEISDYPRELESNAFI